MTNDKAVKLLHRIADEQFDGIHGDERREALEMAVRALEGDGDTIYRQQALDEFWKLEIEIRPSVIDAVINMLKTLPSAQPETPCYLDSPCEYQNKDIKLSSAQFATDTNVGDTISRQAAMVVFENSGLEMTCRAMRNL